MKIDELEHDILEYKASLLRERDKLKAYHLQEIEICDDVLKAIAKIRHGEKFPINLNDSLVNCLDWDSVIYKKTSAYLEEHPEVLEKNDSPFNR